MNSQDTGSAQPLKSSAREQYEAFRARGLKLNMQRGQPSDEDFDLSNDMLTAVDAKDIRPGGLDLRNYPGGVAGIPEARALFAQMMDVTQGQMLIWNNASLEVQAHVLTWALLKGLPASTSPWATQKPQMIVTTPGYDRHFLLLETLGFELLSVDMQPDGPDLDAIERLAASSERVKGVLFVPTYSNPGGETISAPKAQRLAALTAAAPDFTIFADDAYRVHHLHPDDRDTPVNFVELCQEAGHPDRAFVFASTSKITFAGAGLGFVASSVANIGALSNWLNTQSIGPNKVEQYRHVRFLEAYPGGLEGLMEAHAQIIAPKFAAVNEVLSAELDGQNGNSELASWGNPKGGYFISLDTHLPIARRVVELAAGAGVSLTPAGATYPGGHDPHDRNIRLAPTRPPVSEVREAMQVVACCIRLASEEYRAAGK
ncbi:aminotransferase class I/II-fold pyridoxal phosphate-dependent enzyme [Deinococcus ruber]|uniref:Aminopeptidase n=1 Tax=Deinococcus ruber TaxID=1848197 RepID=A0A918C249_9DEIO|nr:aminotransferase class I/II-fold pyridoxal phosphate-dependent enzyme [Deinococcus ruber]GGR00814.1 aminopeptidase [Deinococcus ruber]